MKRKGSKGLPESMMMLDGEDDDSDPDFENFGRSAEEKILRRLIDRAQYGAGISFEDDDGAGGSDDGSRAKRLEELARKDEEDEYGGMVASSGPASPGGNGEKEEVKSGGSKEEKSGATNWLDRKRFLDQFQNQNESVITIESQIKIRDHIKISVRNC